MDRKMSYETFYERYEELCAQYKIAHASRFQINNEEINPDDYDVIVEYTGAGYAHARYSILKNGPELSTQDLAIICDKGNLCFGWRSPGPGQIIVHTD